MKLIKWERVLIHYSWSKDHDTLDWPGIRKFHMSYRVDGVSVSKQEYLRRIDLGEGKYFQKPWRDIGYNFGLELYNDTNEILIGRPLTEYGAHCKTGGMNRVAIGVCVIGKFDDTAPDARIYDVLAKRLLAPLTLYHHIPISLIEPHSKYDTYKTCPGKLFDMKKLRDVVAFYRRDFE